MKLNKLKTQITPLLISIAIFILIFIIWSKVFY